MEIPTIKQQLSILEVLRHYGVKPDRNKRIDCPFHDDKTPSMQVYPDTETVFCFSSNCLTSTDCTIINICFNIQRWQYVTRSFPVSAWLKYFAYL